MDDEIILECYSLGLDGDPYHPPETHTVRLQARFIGHPRVKDGTTTMPSDPAECNREEKTFRGVSGKRYKLTYIDGVYEAKFKTPEDAEDAVWTWIENMAKKRQERHPEEYEDDNWIGKRQYLREYSKED